MFSFKKQIKFCMSYLHFFKIENLKFFSPSELFVPLEISKTFFFSTLHDLLMSFLYHEYFPLESLYFISSSSIWRLCQISWTCIAISLCHHLDCDLSLSLLRWALAVSALVLNKHTKSSRWKTAVMTSFIQLAPWGCFPLPTSLN